MFHSFIVNFCKPVEARDWEIHLHFAVHGSGDTLYGDGFAFFYTKDIMEFGKPNIIFSMNFTT